MERARTRLLPTLGVVSLAALAACGTSNNTTSGGATTGGGGLCPHGGSVTVASDLPTSGGDAAIGGGTEKGVRLAVEQANANHLLGGCTIVYIAKDDASAAKGKHDPQQGAANIRELVANKAVVGVVGPFNSSVAVAELPISNAAGLLQISPSNTDPGLTIPGSDPDIDTRSLQPSGKITYFRIIANDTVQAQVMANFASRELHLTKIYDIDDQETYGKDLSNYFDQDFRQNGGTIVKRVGLPGSTTDFRPTLTDAKSLGTEAIWFGGVASNGSGIIKAQMQDVGLQVPFLSGDGTVDPQYFKDAGAAAENPPAYASSAPDATNLPSAKAFNEAFIARYGKDALVAYSAYGYDCMNILLNAIKEVLQDNGGNPPSNPDQFRAAVIQRVANTDWHGAIGETRFDQRGDTLNHSFTIYVAQGGHWVAKETVSAETGAASTSTTTGY